MSTETDGPGLVFRGCDPRGSSGETREDSTDSAEIRAFRTRHALVYVDPATEAAGTVDGYLPRPGDEFDTEEIELASATVDALDELALWVSDLPRWRSPWWVVDADPGRPSVG